jgi:TP901 family phage tail tape measure protein
MAESSRTIELIFAAIDHTTQVVSGIGTSMESFGESISTTGEQINEFAEPLAHVTELLLGMVEVAQAAAVALLSFSINAAAKFEESFTLMSTKITLGTEDMAAFRQAVLDYASTSSATFPDVVQAIDQVITTLHDQKNAIDLVRQAEELGDATGNELLDTTKLLTLSLKDYGASADQAGQFSDILTTLSQSTGIAFADLANTLGNVGPLAHGVGLTFAETAAALGISFRATNDLGASSTALTRILIALSDPSDQVAKAMTAVGVNFSQSALAAGGFGSILTDIALKTGGSIDKLKELGFSGRSLNAVFALIQDSGGAFTDQLALINASAGSTAEAYAKMALQISQTTQALRNAIEGAAVQIGLPLQQAFIQLEIAAAHLFLAIKEGAEAGAFQELQTVVNETLTAITTAIEKVAANLPEALQGLDFSGLIAQLEIAKQDIIDLFGLGGIDLSTPEGLRAAIQSLIDILTNFVAFHNGVVTALENIFGSFLQLVGGVDQGTASYAKFLGEIGGTAIAATLVTPVLFAIAGAIEAVAAAIKLVGIAAKLNPELLALAAIMLAVTRAFPNLTNTLLEFGAGVALSGAKTQEAQPQYAAFGEAVTAANKVLLQHATGLGLLAPQIDSVALKQTNLNAVTFKQVESSDQLHDSLGKLSTQWVEVDGKMQLVITSSNDYVTALGLMIEKTQEIRDPVQTAADRIGAFFDKFSENPDFGQKFSDNLDLANKGFETTIVATRNAQGEITGFTEALVFSGQAATEATDKTVTGLSKVQEEALKAQKAANDFALEWEKIQSQERIATFQIQAEVDIAAIQAGTEQIKAAFESINETIKSTGDTISSLVKSLTEVGSSSGAGGEILDLLEEENRRRQEALDLQKQLVEAQVAYLNAVIDRLSAGDAQITVTADGLEPELEAFMFKILERIQLRASADAQQFLLGL